MSSPTLRLAEPVRDRLKLLDLNVEYMTWNAARIETEYGLSVPDIFGMTVPEYVARMIDKVCGDPPPDGSFYLAELEGQAVGMGGMRRVHEGVCELKRLYVRPACRGRDIGASILRRAIADALAFGFASMVLDTGPFMRSAHRLYEAAGFIDREPYPEAEVPAVLHEGWRFMELRLARDLCEACGQEDDRDCGRF